VLRIKAYLKISLPVVVFFLLLLMPRPQGLSLMGQRVIAVTAVAVVLWITEAAHMAVVGLLTVVLLTITSAVPSMGNALYGFSQPLVYFLLGVMALALATRKTGLADSVALWLLARAKGSTRTLYGQLIASFAVLAFILPSATTRNSIQMPAYEEALRVAGFSRGSPVARLVMVAMASLNRLGSTALLTGGVAPVTAAALLGGFSWGRWFVLMALPYYSILLLGSILVYFHFRPKGGYPNCQVPAYKAQVTLSRDGRKMSFIVLGAVLLWCTDSWHHLSPSLVALAAAVLVMMPGIGVLRWEEMEGNLAWSSVFVVATSLCLGQAIIMSGTASWLAELLVKTTGLFWEVPYLQLFQLMLVTSLVRLALPNLEAVYSIMIPIAVVFAKQLGLNPLLCGLIVTIVPDSALFYAAQSSSGVIVYQRGHFSAADLVKIATGMTLISYLVIFSIALPFWRLLGETLVP